MRSHHPPDVSACARQKGLVAPFGDLASGVTSIYAAARSSCRYSDVKAASLERLRVSGLLRDETPLLLLDDAVLVFRHAASSAETLSLLPASVPTCWHPTRRAASPAGRSTPYCPCCALSLRGCFRLSTGSIVRPMQLPLWQQCAPLA